MNLRKSFVGEMKWLNKSFCAISLDCFIAKYIILLCIDIWHLQYLMQRAPIEEFTRIYVILQRLQLGFCKWSIA